MTNNYIPITISFLIANTSNQTLITYFNLKKKEISLSFQSQFSAVITAFTLELTAELFRQSNDTGGFDYLDKKYTQYRVDA